MQTRKKKKKQMVEFQQKLLKADIKREQFSIDSYVKTFNFTPTLYILCSLITTGVVDGNRE